MVGIFVKESVGRFAVNLISYLLNRPSGNQTMEKCKLTIFLGLHGKFYGRMCVVQTSRKLRMCRQRICTMPRVSSPLFPKGFPFEFLYEKIGLHWTELIPWLPSPAAGSNHRSRWSKMKWGNVKQFRNITWKQFVYLIHGIFYRNLREQRRDKNWPTDRFGPICSFQFL